MNIFLSPLIILGLALGARPSVSEVSTGQLKAKISGVVAPISGHFLFKQKLDGKLKSATAFLHSSTLNLQKILTRAFVKSSVERVRSRFYILFCSLIL